MSVPFHPQDVTKQGIIKQQQASDGRGVIASDAIYSVLNPCLVRSEDDTAPTGERHLLCSLWSGDDVHTSRLEKSALCIGGYTPPDNVCRIIQTLGMSNDGLLDRYVDIIPCITWGTLNQLHMCYVTEVCEMLLQGSLYFTTLYFKTTWII